ncbi:DoxX family protein [Pleurocapsa sp. FMAR1]|uniref:DoxX family protein n=1 Tax=Pleurocapsa sp. FMAR1 TaxID=3040204 RepID=UPI0029C6BF0E|nr:DoxX family protein [Pleurocapsa sp. FMAR1]
MKCDRAHEQSYRVNHYLSLLSRIFLSTIFLWSGINKIMNPLATIENMSAHGMPLTSVFLVAAIALEILGGLSVLLGIKTRWGAGMLIIFLIPATLIFHTDFSTEIEQAMFLKNLAMLGGLLMLIQYGGGNIVLWGADRPPLHQAKSDTDIKSD